MSGEERSPVFTQVFDYNIPTIVADHARVKPKPRVLTMVRQCGWSNRLPTIDNMTLRYDPNGVTTVEGVQGRGGEALDRKMIFNGGKTIFSGRCRLADFDRLSALPYFCPLLMS